MADIQYKMESRKKLKHLKDLLIIYSRGGEGLTTKALRSQIQKLERKQIKK